MEMLASCNQHVLYIYSLVNQCTVVILVVHAIVAIVACYEVLTRSSRMSDFDTLALQGMMIQYGV